VSGPPRRTVHCADAFAWLDSQPSLAGCSFITSLPDVSELAGHSLDAWRAWFVDAAARLMRRTPDDGVAIFYQTDIKKSGVWIDKAQLVLEAAAREKVALHWHKIVCRRPAGTITFGRPAYSHMLCFSRGLKLDLAHASPDVLPDAGHATWTRGMGEQACKLACRYVLEATPTRTVVDPFCGQGMVLAVANALGLDGIGVELSAKRARKARTLSLGIAGVPGR